MLGDRPTALSPTEHFDGILRQVEAAQKAGVTYFFIGQHFLFSGGTRWLQPVPVLARLAGEIDRHSRLATQILISPLYHPVMLAEELATLDIVTGGRLDIGLGVGYIPGEYAALGVPYQERVARFEEGVQLLRALWTNVRVTFGGRFYRVDDATAHIAPIQLPHPPLWVGAQSKTGIRRAARLGDAWVITPQVPTEALAGRVEIFADERRRLCRPWGRLPLRREIVIGRDREDAIAKALVMTRPWYLQMAGQGARDIDRGKVAERMREVITRNFVVGSAAECADQLRAIGAGVPVNPVVTRGNWPGMTTEDMVRYVETLGAELIPSMREFHPTGGPDSTCTRSTRNEPPTRINTGGARDHPQ